MAECCNCNRVCVYGCHRRYQVITASDSGELELANNADIALISSHAAEGTTGYSMPTLQPIST